MEPSSFSNQSPTSPAYASIRVAEKPTERYLLHLGLFLLTLATTIWAGADLATGQLLIPFSITNWSSWILNGLLYAVPFLLFLTFHEFGHYYAARYHGISTTLPYYIPAPLFFIFNIGTFGAVIRIREPVPSTRTLFDIGVAGPLAGFVVSVIVLVYGLATMPGPEHLMQLPGHEIIQSFILENGRFPTPGEIPMQPGTLFVGQTPLFWLISQFFEGVPPMFEMYHYPVLFAAWLGLFFTALNLLPVGQLDGGHIWYALVGPKWHGWIARGFVMLLLLSMAVGLAVEVLPIFGDTPLNSILAWTTMALVLHFFLARMFDGNWRRIAVSLVALVLGTSAALHLGPIATQYGYSGWLLWCVLIVLFIRIDHPPVLNPEPLTFGRKLVGLLSILVFLLCFSLTPLYMV